MKSERRKQIMTLSILVVAVLVISVGFAAFSTTLRINSSATVNPNSNTFSVKFSTTQDTLTEAEVTPSSSTSGITATNGEIDNSSSPTISNLSAEFKAPGDYVTYVFYARNEGEYDAYLNNINFIGTKTCEAGEGATNDLVQSACSSISATVTVGGVDYTTTTGITNHILNKKTGEQITVTLKYSDNGARADGPFTVNFGEITMVYSTINDSTYTPPVQAACTIERQVTGTYTVGDVVTCGEEQFYVIENESEDTTTGVDMLAAYNLTLSTTNPIQDTTGAQNGLSFSSSSYFYEASSGTLLVDVDYRSEGRTQPYVYRSYIVDGVEQNNIYPYIEAYRDVLEGMGVNVIDAKLLSYEQAVGLGCSQTDHSCSAAPSWLIATSYWTGSSFSESYGLWRVNSDDNFGDFDYDNSNGIRPVITIQTSDLG